MGLFLSKEEKDLVWNLKRSSFGEWKRNQEFWHNTHLGVLIEANGTISLGVTSIKNEKLIAFINGGSAIKRLYKKLTSKLISKEVELINDFAMIGE